MNIFQTEADKAAHIMFLRIDYKQRIDALVNMYSNAEITAAESGAENGYSSALASLISERDTLIADVMSSSVHSQ